MSHAFDAECFMPSPREQDIKLIGITGSLRGETFVLSSASSF